MSNKNTVNHNKFWNEYGWYSDGDEWDDQAEFNCKLFNDYIAKIVNKI